MSRWLRSITTLLVLTLASVCVSAPARAWEVETAHRGFTAAITLAATEISALTASRVREKSSFGGKGTVSSPVDAFGEIRAQQGTTGALTTPNRDAANAELTSTDNQSIGFTGYLKDTESGLYYAKSRYYDPATARFTTEDPEAGKDLEPPSLHRYLYAYNNPVTYDDPSGRCTNNWCGAGMAYGFAKTDQERAVAARAMANANPVVGFMAGTVIPAVRTTNAIGSFFKDLGSSDPEAKARMAQRWDAVKASEQEMLPYKVAGGGAMGAKMVSDLGKSIGTHAAQLEQAYDRNDYVGMGEATNGLVADASQVAGATAAGRSLVGGAARATVVEGASGRPAMQFNEPDVVRDLDQGFSRGTHYPSQARALATDNATNGSSGLGKIRLDASLSDADRFFAQASGRTIAENPVAMRSYARLQEQGTDVTYINDSDFGYSGLWDPHRNSVTINLAENLSPREITSTLIHESSHQTRFFRGFSTPTQYEEYLSFRREALFDLGRRPTLVERHDIWNAIGRTPAYQGLPTGKLPVTSWGD